MKATGIVRRIDDLGRIVIPKEIRRSFRIKEGDPLEIYTNPEGEVIFKKYSPIGELSEFANQYAEVIYKIAGLSIAIMDTEHVIACAGISKREILERRMSRAVEELVNTRKSFIKTEGSNGINAIEGYDKKASVVFPILYNGDVGGAIVVLETDPKIILKESQIKIVQIAAAFLGKQME